MKIPHDKFCILPWVSIETSPIGTVRPCCLAEDEIVKNDGTKFNLATDTDLVEIRNSNYMQELRQAFLDEKQPVTCKKCWNEEAAGRTSKRMHTLDRLKHVIPDNEWTTDAKPLMFVDLKLGNICNLKCRICGSWSSSTFATEDIQHSQQDKKNSFSYQMLKQGAWPRSNKQFWTQMNSVLDQIRYIEFTGGEPFMIQEHFDLLKRIVHAGLAANVEIHYNTNGTHYPDHAEEIWRHFKTVEIAFSVDDISNRFEYQRANASWETVKQNIDKFRILRAKHSNIQLQVCITVNAYNVLYLEDVALWADLQDFDFIYWNMLHEPSYLSVSTLPIGVKTLATERLSGATVDKTTAEEFSKIIDFMCNGTSTDGSELVAAIKELDRRRKQSLANDHQLLANTLGYNAQ